MQNQQPTANQMGEFGIVAKSTLDAMGSHRSPVIPSQAPSEESQQNLQQSKAPLRLRGGGNFIKDCIICCLCCCALVSRVIFLL